MMDELFSQCAKLNTIPWLDCARSYGLSEQFVGDYLKSNNIAPQDVYVSSKWGYTYVANWNVELSDGAPHEVKDHSLSNFVKQVEETKAHIGPYLNLYQVHSATFDSGILTNTEVHEALHRVCHVENGWDIGLSVSGSNQDEIIREAMKICVPSSANDKENDEDEQQSTTSTTPTRHTRRLFDSVQCTYNILEQRPAEALNEVHASGMDIIIKEGLANGRTLRHPKLSEYASKTELNCTPDQLALGAILAQPFQPRVLSGAVTPEQLSSNLGAMYPITGDDVGVVEKLTSTTEINEGEGKEILQHLMKDCCMESERYWKDRTALKWN